MDTTLERVHAKIADLEAKIADLRIVERELQALGEVSPRRQALAPAPASAPKATRKPGPKVKPKNAPKASEPAGARQTIGAAITEVLGQQGPLTVAQIAEHIEATGRDIDKRAISFSLQALKKRGLVKNANGKWTVKTSSRRSQPSPSAEAHETAAAD